MKHDTGTPFAEVCGAMQHDLETALCTRSKQNGRGILAVTYVTGFLGGGGGGGASRGYETQGSLTLPTTP